MHEEHAYQSGCFHFGKNFKEYKLHFVGNCRIIIFINLDKFSVIFKHLLWSNFIFESICENFIILQLSPETGSEQ